MKRNVILILALFLIVISCDKEDVKYSCDPQVDMIVKSGVNEFSEIGLSEFLQYDIELQKAIYRSFSDAKKISFWTEKLDSVILKTEITVEGVNHINKLKQLINSGLFIDKSIQEIENNQLTEFIVSWTKYAKNELNWTDAKIHFIAYSLFFNEDQYLSALDEYRNYMISLSGSNCICNTTGHDDCGLIEPEASCQSSVCVKSLSGCGFLYLYTCNGMCR